MKGREGKWFYMDASGIRQDKNLDPEEPAIPWAYTVLSASSALSIALPSATVVAIYGEVVCPTMQMPAEAIETEC